MGYKGEDLELRTPQSVGTLSSRSNNDPVSSNSSRVANGSGSARETNSGGTIWVDDILLACCNHAFDVAFAHRSAEVRIEHLLYAVTRVDAASEVLEAHGIRDAGLRRESAMVIASGIPSGTIGGSERPKVSTAFGEALRLASAHAATYNRAAGIADLLHVFTQLRPDLSGLELLRRHMVNLSASQQTFHGANLAHERDVQIQTPLQAQVLSPPTILTNATADMNPNVTTTDILQDKRLEALELLVRSLGHDIAHERQSHAGPVQYAGASSQRPASQPPQSQPPPSQPVAGSVPSSPQQAPVLESLLSDMESKLALKLEQVSGHLFSRLDERLGSFETAIGQGSAGGGFGEDGDLSQRLKSLEELIKSAPADMIDLSPIDARLNDIELALLSQDGNLGDHSTIGESLEDLRQKLFDRLDKLNQNTSSQFTSVHSDIAGERTVFEESSAALGAEIKALAGASATHAASAERNLSGVREALGDVDEKLNKFGNDNLETRGKFVDELREVHEAVMKLNENQHTLARSITDWHKDHVKELDSMAERLTQIEENTTKPLEEIRRLSANMDVMYRTTVERYHRRNRFWFWLFGSDDWVGASWPSQTARIEDELRALKSLRKRS